ncbi:MAG: hypothetical protein GX620_07605 [Chloroflexi bacterium]|nr:hypothetical protein [Chloroflexota bacterium]
MSDRGCKVVDAGVGSAVDLAKYAQRRWWTGGQGHDLTVHAVSVDDDGNWLPGRDPDSGEWQVGLEWDEPRDIREVVVRLAGSGEPSPNLRVQYWRKNWPTPAPERLPGARRGWIGRDDPWHGEWVTVRAARIVEGATCRFVFDPLDLAEFARRQGADQLVEAEDYLPKYRRTLKIRVVGDDEDQPAIAGVEAYSTAHWKQGTIVVHFPAGDQVVDWSGNVQAYNGRVLDVDGLYFGVGDGVGDDGQWRCTVGSGDATKGIRLCVLYTDADGSSADRTIVTIRTNARSFSFLVADLDCGPIYIKDYGVLVRWSEQDASVADLDAARADAPQPIYDRIDDEPEQSLSRAMAEIPPLDVTKQAPFGRYSPLGVEAGRQEFALRFNGELFVDKRLIKMSGRDAARLRYPGSQLRFRFGTGDPPDFRERRDGTHQSMLENWLPVCISEWLDREIEYKETAFAALLDEPMTPPEARRGDEDVVAMVRFDIRNVTHGVKRARVWIVIAPQEQIELRDNLVVATGRVVPDVQVARQWRVDPYEETYLRFAVDTGGRGVVTAVPFVDEPGVSAAVPTAVAYDVDLEGGESHSIVLAVPFVSLTDEAEWQKAAELDYGAKLADVVNYWRSAVEPGGLMVVPDTILTEFHKSVRAHIGIAVDKEPTNGLYSVPAATWAYGVCANEACWQITMLDQAGHHDKAEAYLDSFLQTQGMTRLDGLFQSAEGVMQGNDLDDGVPYRSGFSYNLDPGFIMECLANHYWLTRDAEWLERVAPNLIAACEFVIRERQATKVNGPDGGRDRAWGLLPVGHLEDNPEWRHWFAVNAHAYAGMRDLAQILSDEGYPEGESLLDEAAKYREDIRAAARRAMIESPVIRLLDGTYIPHVPTRTGIRGREWGWFREVAYGPIQLLEGDVFDPNEEEMTWVIKDSEDNLFVSREWGRPVDLERYWFSHGGVTIQANLTDMGVDYLRRGQIKHGLRALFNNFGASLYPDVRSFTEHPVVELGHGVGPFYKTSDEAKALVWLRAFLLWEEDDELHLAKGAPRAWFADGQSFGVEKMATFFGPVTYKITANDSAVKAEIHLDPGRAPGALVLHVRLPEGAQIRAVTVDGRAHTEFDAQAQTVRIANPAPRLSVVVEL